MTVAGQQIPAPIKKGSAVYCYRTLPRSDWASLQEHHNGSMHCGGFQTSFSSKPLGPFLLGLLGVRQL